MKIAIDKTILSAALDIVSKAVSTKTTVPICEGVLLNASDRELKLTCNNLESAIEYTVEADVIEQGSTVVNYKLFSDIVKKLPNEAIDLTIVESRMKIDAGSTHMEIEALSSQGFPSMQETTTGTTIEIEQQVLKQMINKVASFVSVNETRPVLQGILIDLKDNELNLVALDGFMMAIRTLKIEAQDINIIINGKVLNAMSDSLTQGKIEIIASHNNVTMKGENIKISLPLIGLEYLNYKQLVPSEYATTIKLETKDFQSAVERLLLVFDTGNKGEVVLPMVLNSKSNSLQLKFGGTKGTFDEEVRCEVSGDEVKIGLDPRRIREIVSKIEDKEFLLKFTEGNKICIMAPVEGDKFLYLLLPVRMR